MIRPDAIPEAFKRCYECGYDLRGVCDEAGARCPECGKHWSLNDLRRRGSKASDPSPGALSPHERRLSGRWLLAILAAIVLALIAFAAGLFD